MDTNLRIKQADITTATEYVIAHQVNCQDVMGSGVAKALFTKWPEVKTDYHKFNKNKTPEELLGCVGYVYPVGADKLIANCYSQGNYGYDGKRYTDYSAIKKCFKDLDALFPYDDIAIPYMYGCGLGGGDWEIVSSIITDIIEDRAVFYKI
jgi:O-acetyl-ADP-ribose deacetylase (regulator of RNase III)